MPHIFQDLKSYLHSLVKQGEFYSAKQIEKRKKLRNVDPFTYHWFWTWINQEKNYFELLQTSHRQKQNNQILIRSYSNFFCLLPSFLRNWYQNRHYNKIKTRLSLLINEKLNDENWIRQLYHLFDLPLPLITFRLNLSQIDRHLNELKIGGDVFILAPILDPLITGLINKDSWDMIRPQVIQMQAALAKNLVLQERRETWDTALPLQNEWREKINWLRLFPTSTHTFENVNSSVSLTLQDHFNSAYWEYPQHVQTQEHPSPSPLSNWKLSSHPYKGLEKWIHCLSQWLKDLHHPEGLKFLFEKLSRRSWLALIYNFYQGVDVWHSIASVSNTITGQAVLKLLENNAVLPALTCAKLSQQLWEAMQNKLPLWWQETRYLFFIYHLQATHDPLPIAQEALSIPIIIERLLDENRLNDACIQSLLCQIPAQTTWIGWQKTLSYACHQMDQQWGALSSGWVSNCKQHVKRLESLTSLPKMLQQEFLYCILTLFIEAQKRLKIHNSATLHLQSLVPPPFSAPHSQTNHSPLSHEDFFLLGFFLFSASAAQKTNFFHSLTQELPQSISWPCYSWIQQLNTWSARWENWSFAKPHYFDITPLPYPQEDESFLSTQLFPKKLWTNWHSFILNVEMIPYLIKEQKKYYYAYENLDNLPYDEPSVKQFELTLKQFHPFWWHYYTPGEKECWLWHMSQLLKHQPKLLCLVALYPLGRTYWQWPQENEFFSNPFCDALFYWPPFLLQAMPSINEWMQNATPQSWQKLMMQLLHSKEENLLLDRYPAPLGEIILAQSMIWDDSFLFFHALSQVSPSTSYRVIDHLINVTIYRSDHETNYSDLLVTQASIEGKLNAFYSEWLSSMINPTSEDPVEQLFKKIYQVLGTYRQFRLEHEQGKTTSEITTPFPKEEMQQILDHKKVVTHSFTTFNLLKQSIKELRALPSNIPSPYQEKLTALIDLITSNITQLIAVQDESHAFHRYLPLLIYHYRLNSDFNPLPWIFTLARHKESWPLITLITAYESPNPLPPFPQFNHLKEQHQWHRRELTTEQKNQLNTILPPKTAKWLFTNRSV